MSYENWKDKIGTFEVMDVRGKKMDFFPALKAKAAALKNGEGLHIIQTFEPVPLYLSLIHILSKENRRYFLYGYPNSNRCHPLCRGG